MVVDWSDSSTPIAVDPVFSFDNGAEFLMFRRVAKEYLLDLVADVDGAVRNAIMRVKTPGEKDPSCFLRQEDLGEGMYLIRTLGQDASREGDSPHDGVMGGPVGELHLPILAHFVDGKRYSWQVSSKWVMHVNAEDAEIRVFDWAKSEDLHVIAPPEDPMNMDVNGIFVSGEAVFWSTRTTKYNGLNVWTKEAGARPFIRWLDDWTRGADALGTDGIDLVWVYGEGKQPDDWVYPVRSVMTAPFTTDPAALKPRRLRSAPFEGFAPDQFHVGCGYAVHFGGNNSTFVVRLSDGVGWILPDAGPEVAFPHPLGVTCKEVFGMGKVGGRTTFTRVRLDSLGPGMPPD